MTSLSNDDTLDSLIRYLTEASVYTDDDVLGRQLANDSEYVESTEAHNTCRECGSDVTRIPEDDLVRVICTGSNRHDYTIATEEALGYRLKPFRVLDDLAEELGYGAVDERTDETPSYVAGTVDDDARLAVVCDTDRYSEVVDELFVDGLKHGRVNAVFAPVEISDSMWDLVANHPIASVTPPFTLSVLAESTDVPRDRIASARMALRRSEDMQARSGDKGDDLVRHLNQNPRLIQSELEHAPIFRRIGTPDSGRLGTRFEKVCEAAFATIDFPTLTDRLGTETRGDNVTDIVFDLQSSERFDKGGEKVLGIVDAKSGAKTKIKRERIVNKHAEYLQQANTRLFDDHHVAHVFVVLSMQGYSSNEIDWFDGIEEKYRESDATMVVLYADALSQMVDMQLSMAQRNQANLSVEEFIDVVRPFFNYRAFRDTVAPEVKSITRVDSDESEDAANYRQQYRERSRLIVVTKEMVDRHFRNEVAGYDMVRRELDAYGDAR